MKFKTVLMSLSDLVRLVQAGEIINNIGSTIKEANASLASEYGSSAAAAGTCFNHSCGGSSLLGNDLE